ncbi:hypothetical protein DRP07_11195 [Archaeoglobales archaeon]|nr:MAG: hypothetical protein DRP07_11195 [Archaeoglobales archaeon]
MKDIPAKAPVKAPAKVSTKNSPESPPKIPANNSSSKRSRVLGSNGYFNHFNHEPQFFSGKSREEFYSSLKSIDSFTRENLDYYDFILRKRTADLKEILGGIQRKKKKLNMYASLALFSSVLSLMAVTMWLYQTGLISSPLLPFLVSAALLAVLNIFVSLKVRSLLYGQ